MPKTEVILTHNIVGLGGESDQVKVAAGYARNYLFPMGYAIPLSGANKRRLEALKQRRAEREAKELNHMTEMGAALSKMTLVIKVKTGEDGKLFGSVTAGTIADELKHQYEAALDKKKIHLPHPIKTLGEHEVELRLHADVKASLKVKVESLNPAPTPEAAAAPAGKEGREGREGGRGERGEARESRGHRQQRASAEKGGEKTEKTGAKAEKADKGEKKPKAAKAEKTEK
jgi:large subunit ribosomal protein L9